MGNFEKHINDHLETLKRERRRLQSERMAMFHDCDCQFCDYDGLADQYTEEDLEEKEKEIAEVERTIKALKRHAAYHKVEVLV